MIFDFLFKKTGKALDENKYFNYPITKQQLAILQSQEHVEFKKTLLEVMENKVAENINLLVHSKNKEEVERYKAVVLVYEDLVNFFLEKPDHKPEKRYTDPFKKATRQKNFGLEIF